MNSKVGLIFVLYTLSILSVIASASKEEAGGDTSVKDGTTKTDDQKKSCYYCGVRELCDFHFHKDDVRNITCEKSCMTFNGYTDDGKRIIVRDCGYFVSNECKDNQDYEGVAVGRICHCKDSDFCNHGPHPNTLAIQLFGVPLILLIVNLVLLG